MVQYKHRLNQLVKGLKRKNSEDGAVAVIVALVMVVLLGFAAVAIDEGSWWDAQAEYQNAADAAALAAANKKYNSGEGTIVTDSDASKAGAQVAQQIFSDNGLQLYYHDENGNPDDISFSYDSGAKSVTVTITKDTGNYFSKTLSGKDTTGIKVSSTAALFEATEEDDNPFGQRSAIEAYNNLNWKGGEACTVTGGIQTGGALTINSAVGVNGGDISSDGDMTLALGGGLTIDGNIYAGKNLTLTAPGTVFNGRVETIGDFTSNNGGSTFNKDILANGKLFVGADTINGNLYGNKEVYINAPGCYIKGDVKSNNKTTINGGSIPTIDGTWYLRGSLQDYQKKGLKNSSGTAANIADGTKEEDLATLQHSPYTWNYDKLADYLAYDPNRSEQPYVVVTKELWDEYVDEKYTKVDSNGNVIKGADWMAGGSAYGSGDDVHISIWGNGQKLVDFINYCSDKNGGKPVFFKNDFIYNQVGDDVNLHTTIICNGNLEVDSVVKYDNGSQGCLISLNGNVTLGNAGSNNTFNGAIMTLGNGKNITLNGTGTINGGVISHGDITMTHAWNITDDTTWQKTFTKTTTSHKKVIRLTK